MPADSLLFVFTKPARPGRVKTRLIGDLTAQQAADLQAAFLDDLLERLEGGELDLTLAWALEPGEPLPVHRLPGIRQEGDDLGERLYRALAAGALGHARVAAVGSDHPGLDAATAGEAFAALAAGADVALGPATDGGYYLIALAARAVARELFAGVPWSTGEVLAATLERCRRRGLAVHLLAEASDVDTPEDLARLAERLAESGSASRAAAGPRARRLLAAWGRLPVGAPS